jgi:gliding motility-associated-like protein
MTGVQTMYCSNDTLEEVDLVPPGGTFTGLPDTLFNPSLLAPGSYTLTYSLGTGDCSTSDTLTFINHPPLDMTVNVSEDTVCDGGAVQIEVIVTGGDPGAPVQYMWSDGLFPVNTQTVQPSGSHTYWVQAYDGCADPVGDSIPVAVFQPFTPVYSTSDTLCYGEPGFAAGSVIGGGNYTFTWSTAPPQAGDSILIGAGQSLNVHVENDASGCGHDTLITVPAWPAIVALFSTNPNDPCIDFDQSNVTFIDLSNNAVGGEWTINGQTIPYVYGENPAYDLAVPGLYNAQLVVYNIGGCVDTFAVEVCILDPTPVFIPDAFSPNGDGSNDLLFVRGPGIVQMGFTVWDRWGERVFESQSPDHGWDGTHRGERMPSGIYVYMLSAVMNDGEKVAITGDVTLVR